MEEEFIKIALTAIFGALTGICVSLFTYQLIERRKLDRIHKQKIIEFMTEKLHNYTYDYYLPVIKSAVELRESLLSLIDVGCISGAHVHLFHRCFYHLAIFIRSRRRLENFFLGDVTAEYFIFNLGNKIEDMLSMNIEVMSNDQCEVLKNGDDNEPFRNFSVYINDEPFKSVYMNFTNWITNERANVLADLLHLYRCVFLIELNQQQLAWYRSNPLRLESRFITQSVTLSDEFCKGEKTIDKRAMQKYLKYLKQFQI